MALWAEICGFAALMVCIVGYQAKMPRLAMTALTLSCLLWTCHFYILGQVPAAMIALTGMARNLGGVYLCNRYMKLVTAGYVLVALWVTAAFFQSAYDLLPLFAAFSIGAASLVRALPFYFRCFSLGGEGSWLVYGLLISSFSLVLASALLVGSLLISMARHDLQLRLFAAQPALQRVPVRVRSS